MGEAGAQDGGDLIYANKKFKNFELEFEYKVDKGANSGVFYLAQEIPGPTDLTYRLPSIRYSTTRTIPTPSSA